MPRIIDVQGIRIFAKTTPCVHSCRYCLVGPKTISDVAFSRFARLVERFIEWRNCCPSSSFSILAGFEDSYEFDVETLKGLFGLYERIGWGDEGKGVKLGGLKLRGEIEMQAWLEERQHSAGLKIVHASLAGCGATHDRWNGRKGDFDYLLRTMTTAANLGLRIHQRLFVVKSTYSSLDELIDRLDIIPGEARRYLSTFVYRGFATRLEGERITEDMRDRLPARIAALSLRDGDAWRSEREWIDVVRRGSAKELPEKIEIELEVAAANLDRLEAMSCDEIVADLTERTQKAYGLLPSRAELCDRSSDPTNLRVYASFEELERMWLDRYLIDHPLDFPRNLTHLAV